jgi:hypothetical protein
VRVHAVSANLLLPRTLEAAMADAEVTTGADPDRLPSTLDADSVVVVDLETTEQGLAAVTALRRRGTACPIVVVGDHLPQHVPDDRITFLIRPVPIGELRDAVERRTRAADPPLSPDRATTSGHPEPARPTVSTDLDERRWLRRLDPRRAPVPPTFDDLASVITDALPVCRDLIRVLDEFPGLGSTDVAAQAFVDDLLEALPRCRTAVALVSTGGAYLEVAGFRGLTAAERLLRVPVAHPLVSETDGRASPLVIATRDARALVSGVPGTRAPVLMVRSLSGPDGVHGLVLIGAASFDDEQVATAAAVIDHGASTVVLASYVERLASRVLPSGQPSHDVG